MVFQRGRQADGFGFIVSLMDWEKNVEPFYRKRFSRPSIKCPGCDENYSEKWIMYANDYIGAKELTILPGRSVTVKDPVAHGCIVIQGHGAFGAYDAEAAIMLRYGQPSTDEYFVSEDAAKEGVVITNQSQFEPMVILKHFGPNQPNMPKTIN